MSSSSEPSTPRGAIRKWHAANPDTIPALLDELRRAQREWQPACSKCGYRDKLQIPDWRARAELVKVLTEAVDGRPGVSVALPAPPPGRDFSTWTDEQLWAVLNDEKPVAPAGDKPETTPGPHQQRP